MRQNKLKTVACAPHLRLSFRSGERFATGQVRNTLLMNISKEEELERELAALRSRLAQLEATNAAPVLLEAKQPFVPGAFDRFFTASLVASMLFDVSGRLTAANPAALRLLGVPKPSDILSRNLFESPSWTTEQRETLAAGDVLRLREPLNFEDVRQSGAWEPTRTGTVWLDWSISSLGSYGYFIQVQDVTREVETEQALQVQARLFEDLFDGIPYPTVVWRHVGNDKFTLDRFNSAANEMSHGQLLEFVGADMDEFHAHAPEFPARVRRTFQTGDKETTMAAYTTRTTGELRHIVTTAAKVGDEYVLDAAHDLTELHEVQNVLVETRDALQRSLQEKELLLQEIHHRVKNNLAIVSSLLEMQAHTVDDERLSKMLRESQNRIMSVARAHEVLYQSHDLRSVDLGRYVEILTKQLHGAFAEDGVLLNFDAASVKLPVSRAVHFGLILNELISNAYKHAFLPEQSDPCIDVSLKRANGDVELTVHDNGCGLPTSFTLEQPGSLGVQVVSLLTEQLEGEIRYNSVPGQGSTFVVRVPYQTPGENAVDQT
jgi:two-component sensor histidine kinase